MSKEFTERLSPGRTLDTSRPLEGDISQAFWCVVLEVVPTRPAVADEELKSVSGYTEEEEAAFHCSKVPSWEHEKR